MIPSCAWSVALQGLSGRMVEVEAALVPGLPRTVIVGLPDASISEAKERCKAAFSSAKFDWPTKAVTINLTPATLPKRGSHYDLAIVAAVWAAEGKVPYDALAGTVLLGELGLDGRVRSVRGLLPALLAACHEGFRRAIVPMAQLAQAELVDGLSVFGVDSLFDVMTILQGGAVAQVRDVAPASEPDAVAPDLADVIGQPSARWALEVAAAGRHHLYFGGPPGAGKSMLAERLPGLLPDLEPEEALEVACVRSLSLEQEAQLEVRPPFEAPHHSSPPASVIGGGLKFPGPGAISRAHKGILFLDEAPEFSPRVLESLRTPLEKGFVTLGRSGGDATYPAAFQLVLAANPCPCGKAGVRGMECRCPAIVVRRYQSRLSGPIRDRIDIQQELLPVRRSLLARDLPEQESTAVVAQRVAEARERQLFRLSGTPWRTNGAVPGAWLRRCLPLPSDVRRLDHQVVSGRLSARGMDRVLRLSWTVADLAGHDRPTGDDVDAALSLRGVPEVAA